ncbi:MAG: MMPL family transporter [Actinomycetota bacterium]|nr:MMPL family transporter [Actinomycetota bacterium]
MRCQGVVLSTTRRVRDLRLRGLLATFGAFSALGPALAIAVFVMLVTVLSLVPALVCLLGRATFWPSRSWNRPPTGTRFQRIGAAVGRRPALTASISSVVLIALASGASHA